MSVRKYICEETLYLDFGEKSKQRKEEEHSLGDYTGFISYTVKLKIRTTL